MKQGWALNTLSDVCEKTSNIKWSNNTDIEFDYIDLSAVSRETFNITNTVSVNSKNAPSRAKKIIHTDDVIFATTRPTLKRVARISSNFNNQICSTGFSVLRGRPSVILPDYIFYYLRTVSFMQRMELLQRGASYPAVTDKDVKDTPIPVPPLPEQKRIVAKLDQAFEAIDHAKANVERNLQNAKDLFQSQLNQIFSKEGGGWVEITLGDLGKVSMCKRIMKHQTSPAGDIPFYKIGTFGETPNAFIDSDTYQEFKQKYSFPKKGAILISASGTIGRRVIYDGEPAYFQDSNIVCIDNNEELVLNEYLYQFYGVCDWNPSKGATISRLYNDDLRRIRISFPNIDEQMELVGIMKKLNEKTQSLIHQYQHQLNNLFEMKNSILQKAFNGELSD